MLVVLEEAMSHPRIQSFVNRGFDVSVWEDKMNQSVNLKLQKGPCFWHYLYTKWNWGDFLEGRGNEAKLISGQQHQENPMAYVVVDQLKINPVFSKPVPSVNDFKTHKTLLDGKPVHPSEMAKHVQELVQMATKKFIGQPMTPQVLEQFKQAAGDALKPFGQKVSFQPLGPKGQLPPGTLLIGVEPIVKDLEIFLEKQIEDVSLEEQLGLPVPPGVWNEFELYEGTGTDKTYVPPKPPVFHHPKVSFIGEVEATLKKHGVRVDRADVKMALEHLRQTCETAREEDEKAHPKGRFVDLSE